MIRSIFRVRLLIFTFSLVWLFYPSAIYARDLKAGWQMVTLSLENETTVEEFFADQLSRVNALWTYSQQTGWEVYSARAHVVEEAVSQDVPIITHIKPRLGYWIHLSRDMSLPDLEANTGPIPSRVLGNPWTLVGCPESIALTRSTTTFDCWTVPAGFFISAVYDYDGLLIERIPGHKGYDLKPGQAYWIKIHPEGQTDRQLTLPDYYGLKRLPNLPFPLSSPCLAQGENDSVWFAGGVSPTGVSSSVFFYDFNTREFVFQESIPTSQSVSTCDFESGTFRVFSRIDNHLVGEQALHRYTPTTHTATIVTVALDLPITRNGSSHTSHTLGDKVYILGGEVGTAVVNELSVFRIADTGRLNLSNLGTRFQTPRGSHTSHLSDSLLVVIGGKSGASPVGLLEVFQVSSDGRLAANSDNKTLLEPRYDHTSHSAGSYYFVLGGQTQSSVVTDSVESIQLTTDNLLANPVFTEPLKTARAEHSSHYDGDFIYVFGGRGEDGNALGSVEVFRVLPGGHLTSQNQVLNLEHPRYAHTIHKFGDYFYIIGGRDQNGTVPQIEILQLAGGGTLRRILTNQNLQRGRFGHQGVLSKNSLIIVGGIQDSTSAVPVDLIEILQISGSGSFSTESITKPSAARFDHTLLANNEYLYMIGGKTGSSTTTESLAIFHEIPLLKENRTELEWRVNPRIQENLFDRGTLAVSGGRILAAGGIQENGIKTASMELVDTDRLRTAEPGILFSENQVFSNTSPIRVSLPDVPGTYSCSLPPFAVEVCDIENQDTLFFESLEFGFHTITISLDRGEESPIRSFVDIVVDAYPSLESLSIPDPIIAGQSVSLRPETSYPLELSCLFSFYSTAPARFTSYGLSSVTFIPEGAGEFQVEVTCYSIFGLSTSTSVRFQVENKVPIVDFRTATGFFLNPGEVEIQNLSRDPEGLELQFLWSMLQTPSDASYTLNQTRATTPVLELNTTGEFTLQLTARDPFGQEAKVEKAIRINAPPTTSLLASSFKPIAQLEEGLSHASALFANNRVYLVGGQNSSGPVSYMIEISPTDGSILTTRVTPFSVIDPDLSFLEPTLFVSGGPQNNLSLVGLRAWDVSQEQWSISNLSPENRIDYAYASNTKVHLLSSTPSLNILSYTPAFSDGLIWLFPPKEKSLALILESPEHTLNTSRPFYFEQFNPKVTARSSEIYLSGGEDREGKAVSYIQHLSSPTNFFDRRLHLPEEQRVGASPVLVEDELWLIGGQNQQGSLSRLIQSDNHTNVDDEGQIFLEPGRLILLRNDTSDPDPLDLLTPSFTITEFPVGSSPFLVTASASQPWQFRPDLEGRYMLRATYKDSLLLSHTQLVPLTVNRIPLIRFFESGPLTGSLTSTYVLTASVENNDWTTYSYRFLSKPLYSNPGLQITSDLSADFLPDRTGAYLLEIRVEDQLGAIIKRIAEIRVDTTLGPAVNSLDVPTSSIGFSDIPTHLSILATSLPTSTSLFSWTLVSKPLSSAASIPTTLEPSITFTADLTGQYLIQTQGFIDTSPTGSSGTRIKDLNFTAIQAPLVQLGPLSIDETAFRPEIHFPLEVREFHGHTISLGFEVSTDGATFQNFFLKDGNTSISTRDPSLGSGVQLTAIGLLTQSMDFNVATTLSYRINVLDNQLGLSIPPIEGTTQLFLADEPPSVELLTQFPREVTDGRLVLDYRVKDPEEHATGITIFYKVEAFGPNPALLNTPNENDLHAATADGIRYQVVWDAHEDLGSNFYTDLEIQILPIDSRSSQSGATTTTIIDFVDYRGLLVEPSEELLRETLSIRSIPSETTEITTMSLVINAEDSNLIKRMEIEVPPGAFLQDIDLSVGHLLELPVTRGFGLSISPSPSVTNFKSVTATIHYSTNLLDVTMISDPALLGIYALNRVNGQWVELPLQNDVPRARMILEIPDLEILHEFLITSRLFQPPGIELLCNRTNPPFGGLETTRSLLRTNYSALSSQSRIALLLRSLEAPIEEYSGENDLIQSLCSTGTSSATLDSIYDSVFTFHYPVASRGISSASTYLSQNFLRQLTPPLELDLYSHGAGGLIARYSMESVMAPGDPTQYLNSIDEFFSEDSGEGPAQHRNEIIGSISQGIPASFSLTSAGNDNIIHNAVFFNVPFQGAKVSRLIEKLNRKGYQIPTEIKTGGAQNFLVAPQILDGINDLGTFSPLVVELRYHQFADSYPVQYISAATLSTANGDIGGDGRFQADSFASIPGFHPKDSSLVWFLDLEFDERDRQQRPFGQIGIHRDFAKNEQRDRPKWVRSRLRGGGDINDFMQISSQSYEDLHNFKSNPKDVIEGFLKLAPPSISTILPDSISQIEGLNISLDVDDPQLSDITLWIGIPAEILPMDYTYVRDQLIPGSFDSLVLSQCCDGEVLLQNWELANSAEIFPPQFLRKPRSSDRLAETIVGTYEERLSVKIQTLVGPGEFDVEQVAVPVYISATDWFGNRRSQAKTIIRSLPISNLETPSINTTQNSATIHWNRVLNALGYEVELIHNEALLEKRLVGSGDETALFFPALKPATEYEFRIRAFNDTFTGNWASIVASTRNAPPTPFPIVISTPAPDSVVTTRIILLEGTIENFDALAQVRIEELGVGAVPVISENFSGEIELFQTDDNLLNLIAGTHRSTLNVHFDPPFPLEEARALKKTITISLHEHELNDGDELQLILNGKKIQETVTLSPPPGRILAIQLRSGKNTLILRLTSEGRTSGHDGVLELSELSEGPKTREWSGEAGQERVILIQAP